MGIVGGGGIEGGCTGAAQWEASAYACWGWQVWAQPSGLDLQARLQYLDLEVLKLLVVVGSNLLKLLCFLEQRPISPMSLPSGTSSATPTAKLQPPYQGYFVSSQTLFSVEKAERIQMSRLHLHLLVLLLFHLSSLIFHPFPWLARIDRKGNGMSIELMS